MMLIELVQEIPTHLTGLSLIADFVNHWHWSASHDWSLLAQQALDTDVFASTRAWFNNFVQSGQVWALIIGLVLGYLFRSFTTYG